MDPVDTALLRKHHERLVRDVDTSPIVDSLLSSSVFLEHHEDEIQSKPTRAEKNRELLRILKTRGALAFEKFIEALTATKQPELAELLQNQQKDNLRGEERKLSNSYLQLQADNNRIIDPLRKIYLKIFRTVNPFSLPFTFDIENTWVSLALKENKEKANTTEDHQELLKRAFTKANMLIIEGKPATGKTSLMRRLAYEWAKGNQKVAHYDLLLYSEFRRVRDQEFKTIADLVNSCLMKSLDKKETEAIGRLLASKEYTETHSVLVLLDGYDESSLEKQCEELHEYLSADRISKPLHIHIAITTRLGYLTKYRSREQKRSEQERRFVFADVLGFTTDEQKQKYISNHFSTKTAEIEAVHRKIKSSKDLNNIAQTPLFLTFICLMHKKLINDTIMELNLNIIWWLLDRYQQAFPNCDVPGLFGFQWEADGSKFEIIQNHYLKFPQLHCLGSMALQNITRGIFEKTDLDEFRVNSICEHVGFLIKEERRDESLRIKAEFYFPHRTIQEFLAAFSYLKTQSISNNDKDFMEREIFNKNISTLSEYVIVKEYEKFLWRIVTSDQLPISPELRLNFFASYSILILDLDILSSSANISFQQSITYIEKCKNITKLFLYSLNSNILLNQPIDLSRLTGVKCFHLYTGNSLHMRERETPNVYLKSITFKSATLFSKSMNHFKKFFNLESTIQLNYVTVISNFNEFSLFCVSTSSETFSRFLSNEKIAKIFADQHLNEVMRFSQYVEELYITEPKRVVSSQLSFAEFSTLSKLVIKHFEFQFLENPINSTDLTVSNYLPLEYSQVMVNLPVLKDWRFSDCSFQENLKFDIANSPVLKQLGFERCSFLENCKLDSANLPVLEKLWFIDCSFKQNLKLDSANSPVLKYLQFNKCSFQENFKLNSAYSPVLGDLYFDRCSFQENFKLDNANSPVLRELCFKHCSFQENFKLDIANSPVLRKFWFDRCSFQENFKFDIANSPVLREMWFDRCSFQEYFKLVSANSPVLEKLRFKDCSFQENFKLDIANSPVLKDLQFNNCSFQENFKLDIANLPVLKDLQFNNCSFQENFKLDIANSPVLRELWFDRCSFQENFKLDSANSPVLEKLRFKDCSFQENFKLNIANLQVLEDLHFEGCSFKENFKLDIANSPVLKDLQFNNCSFQENFKLEFANLSVLKDLQFNNCSFQENFKLDTANLPVLGDLYFDRCSFQENFKLDIANSPVLEDLHFEGCLFQENFKLDVPNLPVLDHWYLDCSFQEKSHFSSN